MREIRSKIKRAFMGKYDKLYDKIRSGDADANIDFSELCQLLKRFGFTEDIHGSHHRFRKDGIPECPNLQCIGSKAKSYQVRQIRLMLVRYKIGEPK